MNKKLILVGCFCFVLSVFGARSYGEVDIDTVMELVSEEQLEFENKAIANGKVEPGDSAERWKQESIEGEKPDPVTIFISVVPDYMKFDMETFTVVAGQEVIIEFENTDVMQHNMLITEPGTLKKVGAAADALARDPKGAQKEYVPEIPEVLYATKMLNPGDFETLEFTAPTEPGDYPYVCTFPGHWRMMNGIMKVVEE